MSNRKIAAGILLLSLISFCREGAKKEIRVENPWIAETLPGAHVAAGYMTLQNRSGRPLRLVGARADVSRYVELHFMGEKDGVMHMEHLKAVDIADGESVEFASGGYHIMLIELSKPLKPGSEVPITLEFEEAPEQTVVFPVKPLVED